jgi:hypothetical protein
VKTKPRYNFRPDATYVIAGGLGGLGRSFARWMVGRGARNLILLSRSGASGTAAKTLVAELSAQGVYVAAPAVDISNLNTLKNEIEKLKERMPQIRGCIQASVALRVRHTPLFCFVKSRFYSIYFRLSFSFPFVSPVLLCLYHFPHAYSSNLCLFLRTTSFPT